MPKKGTQKEVEREREIETATKIKPGKMCPQSHRAWALSQLHFTWPYFTALGNFQDSKKEGGRGGGEGRPGLLHFGMSRGPVFGPGPVPGLAWSVH